MKNTEKVFGYDLSVTLCFRRWERRGIRRGTNKALGKYCIWKIITVWIRPDYLTPKITYTG